MEDKEKQLGGGLGGTIIDKILKSALHTFCTLLYNESYRFQKDVIHVYA